MRDFKKKGNFSRGKTRSPGSFRGGPRRDFSGPTEMHQATCAHCQKVCEVPFRPNGKKPVFCKDCFTQSKPDLPSRSFSRSDSTLRSSHQTHYPRQAESPVRGDGASGGDRRSDDLKSQVEMLGLKIDTLMRMVKALENK